MEAVGTVTDGRGIAAPQMAAHDDAAWREFGWTPTPGTLNLAASRDDIDTVRRWPRITERSDADRTFHLARLGGLDVAVRCFTDTLEVAAPVHLRDTLGLVNGQQVTLSPRASVSVVVMAHAKRRQWAEELAEQLGCPIVWDQRNNVWDTATRAWQTHPPTATHRLVIQDDAIVCDDLLAQAEQIAIAAPTVPVSLTCIGYRIKHARNAYDHADRWWPSGRGISTVALMLPAADIEPMLEACEHSGSRHDDVRIMAWYRNQNRPIWTVKPSLVAHRDVDNPTLVDGNDRWDDRGTLNFVGQQAGAIDWMEGAPVATPDGTATFVHTKTGKATTVKVGSKGYEALLRLSGPGKVWRQVGGQQPEDDPDEPDQPVTVTADEVSPPAKAGAGSSRDAWTTFAALHDVPVEEHMTRDDIVAACERAEVA